MNTKISSILNLLVDEVKYRLTLCSTSDFATLNETGFKMLVIGSLLSIGRSVSAISSEKPTPKIKGGMGYVDLQVELLDHQKIIFELKYLSLKYVQKSMHQYKNNMNGQDERNFWENRRQEFAQKFLEEQYSTEFQQIWSDSWFEFFKEENTIIWKDDNLFNASLNVINRFAQKQILNYDVQDVIRVVLIGVGDQCFMTPNVKPVLEQICQIENLTNAIGNMTLTPSNELQVPKDPIDNALLILNSNKRQTEEPANDTHMIQQIPSTKHELQVPNKNIIDQLSKFSVENPVNKMSTFHANKSNLEPVWNNTIKGNYIATFNDKTYIISQLPDNTCVLWANEKSAGIKHGVNLGHFNTIDEAKNMVKNQPKNLDSNLK